jgi:hypothetical protein
MTAALAYGLSVHHFISQVGDYVGFAAIVAVAIMILLLFAHARETADLRRRADDAEEELALLHEQVQWLHGAQQSGATTAAPGSAGGTQAAPGTVPAPAAARTAPTGTGAGAAATAATAAAATAVASRSSSAPVAPPASAKPGRVVVPGAPVGVGAPALTSATKLIPPTDQELQAIEASRRPEVAASVGPETAEHTEPGMIAAPPAPPPSTAAAGGNGRAPRANGASAAASGGRGGSTSPRRNYGSQEPSGGRRINRGLLAAGAALVVAIAVVLVLVLSGGSGKKDHAHAATNPAASGTKSGKGKAGKNGKGAKKAAVASVDPSSVTVSVLNGTMTSNLAADVSTKLTAKGFQAGSTGNASDQGMQATVVGYVPSVPDAKNDAFAVAQTLGLKQAAVKPVSSANQAVACSGASTNCPDQVIVTVGADLNSDAT